MPAPSPSCSHLPVLGFHIPILCREPQAAPHRLSSSEPRHLLRPPAHPAARHGTARRGASRWRDLLLPPPLFLLPPSLSPSLPPSPRPRVAPVMERASPSPSSAPSNAPSNRATSAPAGPIRAGNIWAPTSAGCGREVMRSSVAAGTRRSCHHRHHRRRHHQQHRHHLLQEQRGKDGAALPLEPGLAG